MTDLVTRRAVLRAALAAGAAWAASDLVQVDEALAYAAQQTAASDTARVTTLTADQGVTLDALTSRIIPSVDGRPGAHEAGALYFIDKALGTFNAGQKAVYENGLRDLNRRASEKSGGAATFPSLPASQQDEILRRYRNHPILPGGPVRHHHRHICAAGLGRQPESCRLAHAGDGSPAEIRSAVRLLRRRRQAEGLRCSRAHNAAASRPATPSTS